MSKEVTKSSAQTQQVENLMNENKESQPIPQPIRHSYIQSSIISSTMEALIQSIFDGIKKRQIERQAPQFTSNRSVDTLEMMVGMGFTANQTLLQMRLGEQTDPIPCVMDNLAVQEIESQQKKQACNKSQAQKSKDLLRKNTVAQKIQTQLSPKSRATTLKLTDFPEPVADKEQQRIRNNFFSIQRDQEKRQNQLLEAIKAKELLRIRNQKLIKESRKSTYDYQGRMLTQDSSVSVPQKLLSVNNKLGQIKKVSRRKPSRTQHYLQTTEVSKKKTFIQLKKNRQPLVFRDSKFSIAENIQKSNGIAQGVKITQDLGKKRSITKEGPQSKKRFNSLREFKNSSKITKFKEYGSRIKQAASQNSPNLDSSFSTINQDFFQLQKSSKTYQIQQRVDTNNNSIINAKNNIHSSQYLSQNRNAMMNMTENQEQSTLRSINNSKTEYKSLLSDRHNSNTRSLNASDLPLIKSKALKSMKFMHQQKLKQYQQTSNSAENIESHIKYRDSLPGLKNNRISIQDTQLFSKITIAEVNSFKK